MKTRELILIVAAICVAGFVVAAFTVPVLPKSQPFNLSRTLPTGTTSFNGQLGCGPNVTVREVFPSNGIVRYWITQNETGASVNIWTDSVGIQGFMNTGYGGVSAGSFTSGNGVYTFVFQACGSTPTVSLGFWGGTNYSTPLL
ncbi:MAG: hypothetical protein WCB18_03130 [Thermoplasmata archaeon]